MKTNNNQQITKTFLKILSLSESVKLAESAKDDKLKDYYNKCINKAQAGKYHA